MLSVNDWDLFIPFLAPWIALCDLFGPFVSIGALAAIKK